MDADCDGEGEFRWSLPPSRQSAEASTRTLLLQLKYLDGHCPLNAFGGFDHGTQGSNGIELPGSAITAMLVPASASAACVCEREGA